eukprot:7061740-Pyramimonas_sp.AAC.1
MRALINHSVNDIEVLRGDSPVQPLADVEQRIPLLPAGTGHSPSIDIVLVVIVRADIGREAEDALV